MPRNQKLSALVMVAAAVIGLAYTFIARNEPLLGLDLQGGVSVVLQPTEPADDEALEQSISIIRNRVDALGVAEPEISRQGDNIVVDLPGVEEQQRALELVGQTAELRFRPVIVTLGASALGAGGDPSGAPAAGAPTGDPAAGGEPTDPAAGDPAAGGDAPAEAPTEGPAAGEAPAEAPAEDPAAEQLPGEPATPPAPDAGEEQSLGAAAGRFGPVLPVSATSTSAPDGAAPTTQAPGTATTAAPAEPAPEAGAPAEPAPEAGAPAEPAPEAGAPTEPPPEGDATTEPGAGGEEPVEQPGSATQQAAVEACLSRSTVTPPEEDDPDAFVLLADERGTLYCLGPTLLTGEAIETAVALPAGLGQWEVRPTFRGGAEGIDRFNQAAELCFSGNAEVCPSRLLAIVLDNEVIVAPQIQAPSFARDVIRITGGFTQEEAQDVATVLRYGALPVELEAQQTRTVSATIGEDALDAGIIAGLVGLAVVALYLLVYYRLAGLVVIGGLLISGMLLWTIIAWFGEKQGLALTTAGIVGIIVSIGVAADSNIVYFENVKDAVRSGRTVRTSIERAYKNSISTIIKADVVSLIAAVLLYWLTVGAVRGFAFYLGLATLLDLFVAWFFMRPALNWLARSPLARSHPSRLGLPAPAAPAGGAA